jgi:catechol 2,3-dioxygenase-like lactoylglutathione lyase family enzyme
LVKLIRGLNHIAVMTEDLNRFAAFYAQVFEAETLFREDAPAFRHAILRAGWPQHAGAYPTVPRVAP